MCKVRRFCSACRYQITENALDIVDTACWQHSLTRKSEHNIISTTIYTYLAQTITLYSWRYDIQDCSLSEPPNNVPTFFSVNFKATGKSYKNLESWSLKFRLTRYWVRWAMKSYWKVVIIILDQIIQKKYRRSSIYRSLYYHITIFI